MIGTVDRRTRNRDDMAFRGRAAKPFQQSRRADDGTRKILERLRDRQPNRGSTGKMEDLRRQPMRGCHRIQIGRVDLAIEPGLEAKTRPIKIRNGTMPDAMDDMAGVRQFAGEITADKTV